MELFLENFQITSVIDEIAATISPLAEKNSNTLIIHCPDGVGNMYADLTKVRQMLLNLLSNACKFTDQGTVILTISRTIQNDQSWLSFKVSDSGIGMTPEQQKKLFKAFSQADASTTRKYGGTGLGLIITKKFCEMMGGDIQVESQSGQGSTFIINLPTEVSNTTTEKIVPHTTISEPKISTQTTILVIDDDLSVHDTLTHYLNKQGFHVITANNGEEGLQLAREHHPDAITLDVLMPEMDGWSVLSTLKADPVLASIPVIMLSMVDNKNLGYALGASEYLLKPIDSQKLTSNFR